MTILVVANGDIADDAWLRARVAQARVVIAADGGANHLLRIGARPSLVVGDMDSLDKADEAALRDAGVMSHRFPAEKDETDLELALRFAVAAGDGAEKPVTIEIAGALGGRLDQTLANVFLLAHPVLDGRQARLIAPAQTAWLAAETTRIDGAPGDRVSLIPLGGDVTIRASAGLRWPLEDVRLRLGEARGVSNKLVGHSARLNGVEGRLLIVHSPAAWER